MGGRKPLPTQVKQINGTLQPCRTNYHEPIPEGLLVEPPDYMPEGAKVAWRYALECAPPIPWAGSGHSDYIAYVDESGDHSLTSIDPDYPVFVLSFSPARFHV